MPKKSRRTTFLYSLVSVSKRKGRILRGVNVRASLIVLIVCFFGVVISGCITPSQPQKNETSPTTVSPPPVQPPKPAENETQVLKGCAGKPLPEEKDNCFLNEGKAGNLTACEQVENVITRNNCFYGAARALNSSSICDNIRSYTEKISCIEEIRPPCTGLENESKAACLAKRYNDAGKCGEYGDACVYEYALSKANASACTLISSSLKKYECQAILTNDLAYCYTPPASDNTTRDACFTNVAKQKNDSSICAYAVTRMYVNLCYEYFALASNDVKLCSKKYDELDRDDCYAALARQTGNASSCGLIVSGFVDKALHDVCYDDVARKYGDPAACSGIKRDYYRYNCYAAVIEGQYEFSKASCDAIPAKDAQWKDNCYSRLAKKTGDKTLCASIQDQSLKNTCLGIEEQI